jgi:hypothetical protein
MIEAQKLTESDWNDHSIPFLFFEFHAHEKTKPLNYFIATYNII